MVGALQAAGLSGSQCILAMSRWMYIASMSLAPSTTCCLEEMGLTALRRYVPIQLSVLDLRLLGRWATTAVAPSTGSSSS